MAQRFNLLNKFKASASPCISAFHFGEYWLVRLEATRSRHARVTWLPEPMVPLRPDYYCSIKFLSFRPRLHMETSSSFLLLLFSSFCLCSSNYRLSLLSVNMAHVSSRGLYILKPRGSQSFLMFFSMARPNSISLQSQKQF